MPPSKRFHYGWVIVLAGALTIFSCFGLARFAFGMLLPAMRDGLGLSIDDMGFLSTGNFAGYLIAVGLAPLALRHVSARKLVTGSLFDVQFDNLSAKYLFGFAAFDNAQVQHATGDEPLTLVFGK